MKTNRYEGKELIGKRVKLLDGRQGIVTSGGYGMLSIDLDCGWWICGPINKLI